MMIIFIIYDDDDQNYCDDIGRNGNYDEYDDDGDGEGDGDDDDDGHGQGLNWIKIIFILMMVRMMKIMIIMMPTMHLLDMMIAKNKLASLEAMLV